VSERECDFERVESVAATPTPSKTRITFRIGTDVLNWFRRQAHNAGGGNYQTLIEVALREPMDRRDETLENVLRRVIRDELKAAV
jgi:uncharacterized protein (DUF4415 family)